MNGKDQFTEQEAIEIKSYLKTAREVGWDEQKNIRGHLRGQLGFYITDFTRSRRGFTPEDFDALVAEGKVVIR